MGVIQFGNWNHDLTVTWWNDNYQYTPNYGAIKYNYIAANVGWKYCMTPHVNNLMDYDDIPWGNAMHGDVCFKPYGGIDHLCNDDHDGADLP